MRSRARARVCSEGSLERGELRSYALATLPDYMVPKVYVMLPALPLSVNGKLDVKALPKPAATDAVGEAGDNTQPRTKMEENILEMWEAMLERSGAEPLGIHSNFFDSGGHSLLAAQIISQVSARACLPAPSVIPCTALG